MKLKTLSLKNVAKIKNLNKRNFYFRIKNVKKRFYHLWEDMTYLGQTAKK
jgi:hypothetical protein